VPFAGREQVQRFWLQSRRPLFSGLGIALLTFCSEKFHFNTATVVLLYLLVLVMQSLDGRFVWSAIVAVLSAACLDFFFLPPLHSLQVADPFNILALFVFLVIALLVTRLVTKVRVEAQRAKRQAAQVEQLYELATRLLLISPDQIGGVPAVKVFRSVLGSDAVCLFDGSTNEFGMDGVSRHDLADQTRQAYFLDRDTDDGGRQVFIRCLRIGGVRTGAIGFEGLSYPMMISGALSVLAATALERAQNFRRASNETAAAQAEVFRTAILDALAHEFKTPLATILAVIGGIRESRSLEPEQEEMADMIESEVSRLSHLTTRLLRTARLDQQELKLRVKPIDIVSLVERVVHRYVAQSNERRVSVIREQASIEVPADRQLLELALTQLLDNAFKYSLPAGEITVHVRAEGDVITTTVSNEGHAIAPDERDRIFERFYRGARIRNLISGTGLGLYVARKIAAAHGGSLDLINDGHFQGVVFCLKLPVSNHGSASVAANH
jgi:two-component system sensor histidine kinase KdpD